MELGVHFNTVAEAYRELAAEGWLELRHGRGAVVLPRKTRPAESGTWIGSFRDNLRSLVAQVRAEGALPQDVAAELEAMAKAVKEL